MWCFGSAWVFSRVRSAQTVHAGWSCCSPRPSRRPAARRPHSHRPTGALADAALLIATGLLMAAALPLPLWVLCSAALALAVLRGLANSAGAVPQTNLVLFAAGLRTAGYAVVTLSMDATASFCGPAAVRPGWRSVAIRHPRRWQLDRRHRPHDGRLCSQLTPHQPDKSFLLLFFQKRRVAFPYSENRSPR